MPEKGKTLALMPLIKTIYRRKAFFFVVVVSFFSMTRNGSTLVCHAAKAHDLTWTRDIKKVK